MRRFFRYFWLPFYRRWAMWHILRVRIINCGELRLSIPPGVFHPGIYFSSPIFISFLQSHDFQNKKVLDVGTGSGLLALFAAQRGGIVTALDISPLAVETASNNALANGITVASPVHQFTNNQFTNTPITFLESDLFDQLASQPFDIVLINPPYYPRRPQNMSERAFFAGENLEYFEKLFAQLAGYLSLKTCTWLILSEDCDFFKIKEIAAAQGFLLRVVFEKKKWGERLFVVQADTRSTSPLKR